RLFTRIIPVGLVPVLQLAKLRRGEHREPGHSLCRGFLKSLDQSLPMPEHSSGGIGFKQVRRIFDVQLHFLVAHGRAECQVDFRALEASRMVLRAEGGVDSLCPKGGVEQDLENRMIARVAFRADFRSELEKEILPWARDARASAWMFDSNSRPV